MSTDKLAAVREAARTLDEDRVRLEWYDRLFQRVIIGEAPKVGEAVLAARLVICVKDPATGELVPWSRRNERGG